MSDLGERFEQLGLSHYFDSFVSEGFDTWETVLDITESDLNALNVKLGHRRKLQRAIAETRGQYPDRALPLFTSKSVNADSSYRSDDSNDTRLRRSDGMNTGGTSTKRKYRRHPKPDEHAPERPASAYVIFSNQMREELKGQELSFTEIAKVVGERWQVLSPEARENYEREANTAKEKYYAELTEYKKTPQYAEYQEYLKEFKAKHAPQNEGKRSKLEPEASTSSQTITYEPSDRRRVSHSDGFAATYLRSGSSPPNQNPYSKPGPPHLTQSATSPATQSFSVVNSPRTLEQYSPMSASPHSASISRDPYDSYHAANAFASDGRDRQADSSHSGLALPPLNSSLMSASATPPSGQQAQRNLPRRAYRDSQALPPLVHEDTTLSSDSNSITSTQPAQPAPASYLPIASGDVSKGARILPQPIPTLATSTGPYLATSSSLSTPDLRPGASSIAALLRADELTRDAENSR